MHCIDPTHDRSSKMTSLRNIVLYKILEWSLSKVFLILILEHGYGDRVDICGSTFMISGAFDGGGQGAMPSPCRIEGERRESKYSPFDNFFEILSKNVSKGGPFGDFLCAPPPLQIDLNAPLFMIFAYAEWPFHKRARKSTVISYALLDNHTLDIQVFLRHYFSVSLFKTFRIDFMTYKSLQWNGFNRNIQALRSMKV